MRRDSRGLVRLDQHDHEVGDGQLAVERSGAILMGLPVVPLTGPVSLMLALDASFVMKDLHKYRDMPEVLHTSPHFFTTYPTLVNQAARTMFTVDGVDKKTKEKAIFGSFKTARRWGGLVGDAFKLWRAFR